MTDMTVSPLSTVGAEIENFSHTGDSNQSVISVISVIPPTRTLNDR